MKLNYRTGETHTEKELRKMSNQELHMYLRTLAKKANARIADVGDLRKYSNVYSRKYDPMLFGNTVKNIGTKSGTFSFKASNKQNMIDRIYQAERFLNNPFTDRTHASKYIEDLKERTGIQNDDDLKELFDVYREYGYDDYKDDSDKIIQVFSEMLNSGYDIRKLAQFISEQSYKDQSSEISDMSAAWDEVQMLNQFTGNRVDKNEVLERALNNFGRKKGYKSWET